MARAIDANELYRIEKLLDTDIVRQDKVALNLLEQVLYDIQHIPTLTQPNEPLTIQQLREMDGEPVWVEFEDGSGGLWGIVHITIFAQIVFANGLHCTIGERYYGKSYKAYRSPPEGEA